MSIVNEIKNKILKGGAITKDEAMDVAKNALLDELCVAADEIRKAMCGERFNLCSIINVKSGRCSEDCKYCAQSAHFKTGCKSHDLLPSGEVLEAAKFNENSGVHRFSLVSSGRGLKNNGPEIAKVEQIYNDLRKHTKLHLCASFGLMDESGFVRLKASGVQTYHHNLETSRRYYPSICTTHTFDDRIATIKVAQNAGLDVCSGGIFGLGESLEDRIDMAFELANLGIKSVPINILTPIAGTPLQDTAPLSKDELLRSISIFRFILPRAYLRFAGGRRALGDKVENALRGGINSALTGDFLTTTGDSIQSDKALFTSLGFDISFRE